MSIWSIPFTKKKKQHVRRSSNQSSDILTHTLSVISVCLKKRNGMIHNTSVIRNSIKNTVSVWQSIRRKATPQRDISYIYEKFWYYIKVKPFLKVKPKYAWDICKPIVRINTHEARCNLFPSIRKQIQRDKCNLGTPTQFVFYTLKYNCISTYGFPVCVDTIKLPGLVYEDNYRRKKKESDVTRFQ